MRVIKNKGKKHFAWIQNLKSTSEAFYTDSNKLTLCGTTLKYSKVEYFPDSPFGITCKKCLLRLKVFSPYPNGNSHEATESMKNALWAAKWR
jgi:hypothetical protein